MAFSSGKDGIVKVGSTDMKVTSWSFNDNSDALEVTNTSSGGFREYIGGLDGGDGSFTAHWDDTNKPTTAMKPGDKVALTLTLITGTSYTFDAIITQIAYSVDVTGLVDYTANFTATGTINRA